MASRAHVLSSIFRPSPLNSILYIWKRWPVRVLPDASVRDTLQDSIEICKITCRSHYSLFTVSRHSFYFPSLCVSCLLEVKSPRQHFNIPPRDQGRLWGWRLPEGAGLRHFLGHLHLPTNTSLGISTDGSEHCMSSDISSSETPGIDSSMDSVSDGIISSTSSQSRN